MDSDEHGSRLAAERQRLLGFGLGTAHPLGGAAWLDDAGNPDLERPVQTWITARMVHVYGLGLLLGREDCRPVAEAALAGLTGPLHDGERGGWFAAVLADGSPEPPAEKSCYAHAFVVLAASTATLAALDGGRALLEQATRVLEDRFWDDEAGLCRDSWDRGWSVADGYRGINANMHAVEAMLSAVDAGADPVWRQRALRICRFVERQARGNHWRIPEHYDASWVALPDYHRENPRDPFKPFGATVGHGFEWARLMLHLEAALGTQAPDWLAPAAVSLFDRAATDGWAVDGEPGFVYTTDWAGVPVVRERMHWVAAEAVAAAAVLHRRTGKERYARLYRTWWEYVDTALVDRDAGSWHHELDVHNQPAATVWPGKPDLYHAVQATLVPRLPLAPMPAAAVRAGSTG
ncbi:AGE family epimerase/isomerase [Nocardioides mesophilus]|uniref:AGE family epimerase/isomerase n=1 Tax=Nocardioides mesophilus TaxID=433659 RepID=A0A7G9RH81_9ACTN|nr:AGE family epimerase/isomerase [Nocardioides mesophilus]